MEKYSEIPDSALDFLVRRYQGRNPHCGQVMLQGYLRSINVNVQRKRIRDATNNISATVRHFYEAIEKYGIPSRVRSDKGGENILVCYYMVITRGVGRASFLAGSSTRNQRIERLWRVVYRCVASTYHSLFHSMEARVHNGRRVSNCPIIPAASPRTPLALICEELLFSQISFIHCIWRDA